MGASPMGILLPKACFYPSLGQLFAIGVHIVHELVDQGNRDLFFLALGVGHFTHEDVAGGVDAAFGVSVEQKDELLITKYVRFKRPKACSIPAWGTALAPPQISFHGLVPTIFFLVFDSIFGKKSPVFFLKGVDAMMFFLIVNRAT